MPFKINLGLMPLSLGTNLAGVLKMVLRRQKQQEKGFNKRSCTGTSLSFGEGTRVWSTLADWQESSYSEPHTKSALEEGLGMSLEAGTRLITQKKGSTLKLYLLAAFIFTVFLQAQAHTINYALEKAPTQDVISYYLKLGYQHIIPEGFDHILFVVGLCLLSRKLSVILWQATAFTVAHSITLALSMKNVIVAPPALVEPIIALSILFVAIENILLTELKPWRILLVFLFGLIHGMGFASSLNEIGLPRNKFLTSILSFNVGVELGQVTVILAMFLFIIIPLGKQPYYRKWVVYPLSTAIALVAAFWTVERVFF